MTTDPKTRRNVVRARSELVLDYPFFGHLALQMTLVEDCHCDTAWSDGRTLAYNPHYARMLSREKLKGLMGHVVMHPACRHHLRRNGRDPETWNMACDYAINWILLEAGLTLPDGYLDDPDLRGKTADDIYTRLTADGFSDRSDVQDQNGATQMPDEGESIDTTDAAGRPEGQHNRSEDDERWESSSETITSDPDHTDEAPMHTGQSDPGRSGEVRDAPPPDDASTDENQWRINLAQAASRARTHGADHQHHSQTAGCRSALRLAGDQRVRQGEARGGLLLVRALPQNRSLPGDTDAAHAPEQRLPRSRGLVSSTAPGFRIGVAGSLRQQRL
jgi:hypothetical protein